MATQQMAVARRSQKIPVIANAIPTSGAIAPPQRNIGPIWNMNPAAGTQGHASDYTASAFALAMFPGARRLRGV
jgi:hypothetical protein